VRLSLLERSKSLRLIHRIMEGLAPIVSSVRSTPGLPREIFSVSTRRRSLPDPFLTLCPLSLLDRRSILRRCYMKHDLLCSAGVFFRTFLSSCHDKSPSAAIDLPPRPLKCVVFGVFALFFFLFSYSCPWSGGTLPN